MTKWLCLLAGGCLQNPDTGHWHTCGQTEGDDYGITWDRLRVEASAVLYHSEKADKMVVSGGLGQLKYRNDTSIPSVGLVAYQELIELGVLPEDLILEDNGSDNTWRQLKNLKQLVESGAVAIEGLKLLGQRFHIARMWAIIKFHPDLDAIFGKVSILSAEDILIEADPARWKKPIEEFMASSEYSARLVKEHNGIRQIAEGTYRFQ